MYTRFKATYLGLRTDDDDEYYWNGILFQERGSAGLDKGVEGRDR